VEKHDQPQIIPRVEFNHRQPTVDN